MHTYTYTRARIRVGSGIPGGKIEVSSSLRVINNRYIIGGVGYTMGEREGERGPRGTRGRERGFAGRDAREGRSSSPSPRKEGGKRGCREREEGTWDGGKRRRTVARAGRTGGKRRGRGSDLHKYIEFIEMSLGIAARRILAAYQPPRRFIPSTVPRPSPPPTRSRDSPPHRPLSHLLRSRG